MGDDGELQGKKNISKKTTIKIIQIQSGNTDVSIACVYLNIILLSL